MAREELRWILEEWFTRPLPRLIPRRLLSPRIPPDMALGVVGIRRAGKTYALFELAQHLREHLGKHQVVYLNFEDDRLLPLWSGILEDALSALFQYFPVDPAAPLWLLLDEIQHVPNWQATLRRFLDQQRAFLVFTGSSATLTPRHLSATLVGRVLSRQILPLSFREYLRFIGEPERSPEDYRGSRRNLILRHLEQYLQYGGFPAVVLRDDPLQKREILSAYIDSVFYRDLVERHQVRKVTELEAFVRLLVRNTGAYFSVTKMTHTLRSLGFSISKSTVSEYLNFALEAFLIFTVEIFSHKLKNRLQYPRKIYTADPGIANLHLFRFKTDWGQLLETAVFLELKRRSAEVYYWKENERHEVDFVRVHAWHPVELIQVAWELGDSRTRNRELRALERASQHLQVHRALLITRDTFGEWQSGPLQVRILPFWYWALLPPEGT